MPHAKWIQEASRQRAAVETRLEQLLPPARLAPCDLDGAVRHALLAPGKRLRPLLTLMSAAHFGGDPRLALDPACAIEMVHTASLILDDLPAMDDATMRRGRPATHVTFGEDAAILAAVALLNHAFTVVSRASSLPADVRVSLIEAVSSAVGFEGLVAGQMSDLRDAQTHRDMPGLQRMHQQKTGVLFVAAVDAGACVAGASAAVRAAAGGYATELGLAFQIQDDLLDACGTAIALGKDVAKDAGKKTAVALLGTASARSQVEMHLGAAVEHLASVGMARGPLGDLACWLYGETAARLAETAST